MRLTGLGVRWEDGSGGDFIFICSSYQLTGRFRLFGNIGFCDLKPTFKNTTVMVFEADGLVVPGIYSLNNSISAVSANSHTFNYIQPMNSIDLSVGIGMRL
jgi:hypothetical protein